VLGVEFVEGDQYHSAENVQRMKAGIPLTDKDREQWLRALAARLREAKNAGTGLVMSCSALKRSYRDMLRAAAKELRFVFLRGERTLIAQRLAGRTGHYMPATLLESQLATLEEPSPDEDAWVIDITDSPETLVAALVTRASA
jgi:gluconokinase